MSSSLSRNQNMTVSLPLSPGRSALRTTIRPLSMYRQVSAAITRRMPAHAGVVSGTRLDLWSWPSQNAVALQGTPSALCCPAHAAFSPLKLINHSQLKDLAIARRLRTTTVSRPSWNVRVQLHFALTEVMDSIAPFCRTRSVDWLPYLIALFRITHGKPSSCKVHKNSINHLPDKSCLYP